MSAEITRLQEEALLARIRQGDREVLGELFALHRERLGRMIAFRMDRRLSARVDADDVLQETFLAAGARIDGFFFGAGQSFFVWLRLVAMQTLFDVHRRHVGALRRSAGRDVSIETSGDGSSTSSCLAACLAGSITSPSQAAAGLELTRHLQEAIASMAEIDQEILALRHFEDLTNLEAAEALEISPTAASNRYVRAVARLKEILTPFGEIREE